MDEMFRNAREGPKGNREEEAIAATSSGGGSPRNFERGQPIEFSADESPLLVVVIDTEEEFDWSKPLSRANTATRSIEDQGLAAEVFARHGVVPTYVIDYPVATHDDAIRVLRTFQDSGRCEIGAHLHPWVNPPHTERVTSYNSYPGNLPPTLEREKIQRLTDAITENFGQRPTVYKAGRYGVGPATGEILEDLGYDVDASVVPYTEFTADGGPDFRHFGFKPFWFGRRRRLLEIPLSVGFAGGLRSLGPGLYPSLACPMGVKLHIPGVLARLNLLERIRLTPEGESEGAHRRVTRALLECGCRVFSLTFHSPSLRAGMTPYVHSRVDLDRFLHAIDAYLRFFMDELGGRPTTPTALFRQLAEGAKDSGANSGIDEHDLNFRVDRN